VVYVREDALPKYTLIVKSNLGTQFKLTKLEGGKEIFLGEQNKDTDN
jgi:hypothetical protein